MAVLTVGAGKQFASLKAAIAASHDGDVIKVQAGTYTNDFAEINTKITIEGVGGMVNLVATTPPPNGKAILVTNTDVTLDHIAFSGAKVADGNGAGIRYQGGNLVLNDCYFHDNQDGLLAAGAPGGTITINNSEFAHNGSGTGQTHNLYVNKIAKLTITGSYFHDAVVGHEIKSRALNTVITDSRIVDGPTGTASYSIDLPNGGNATIRDNVIEQGPHSQNPYIIRYGEEGNLNPGATVLIANNTILNDDPSGSSRAVGNTTTHPIRFVHNAVYGLTPSQIAVGPVTVAGTRYLTKEPSISTAHPFDTTARHPPLRPTIVPAHRLNLVLLTDTPGMRFIARLDGKPIGALGTRDAFGAHRGWQFETLTARFGAGPHTLTLDALPGAGMTSNAHRALVALERDHRWIFGSTAGHGPNQHHLAVFTFGAH